MTEKRKILYTLFSIVTIVAIFIVYNNIENSGAYKFLLGYTFLAVFMFIFMFFITILKMRKLKRADLRKKLFNFIALFVILVVINYGFGYFLKPSDLDLVNELTKALFMALAITFIDVY